jgi:WhiB family redox-sensing transcriptional regulator
MTANTPNAAPSAAQDLVLQRLHASSVLPWWHSLALCAQTDSEAFFPEKGASAKPAKRICAECPVQTQCLDWALDRGERYGIWGGTTHNERRAILAGRSPRRRAA